MASMPEVLGGFQALGAPGPTGPYGWLGSTISLADSADTAPWWSHGYLAMGLLTAVVILAAVWDWRTAKIPNWLDGPAFLLGFLLAGLTGYLGPADLKIGWEDAGWPGCSEALQSAALSFSIAFVPFFVIWRMGALGGGDVKLIGTVGAIGGKFDLVVGAAFYGFLIAVLIAVYLMIRHRVFKRTIQRIANAALMSASRVKPEMSKDTIYIPLGVAFGIGAILAGVEVLLGIDVPWSLL